MSTRQHQLQRLLPKHYKILDLVLAGWKQRRIADELGLSYVGVSNIVTSVVFQAELARRREEQNRRIDRALRATAQRGAGRRAG